MTGSLFRGECPVARARSACAAIRSSARHRGSRSLAYAVRAMASSSPASSRPVPSRPARSFMRPRPSPCRARSHSRRRGSSPAASRRAAAGGPLDYAFEVVGLPATIAQAVGMVGYGGTVVIVGVPPTDSTVTLPLARGGLFNKKVTLTSCSGGDMVPSEFFPRLMRWYLDGTLRLDEMVTREIGPDDVVDAFAAMTGGTLIRSEIRL